MIGGRILLYHRFRHTVNSIWFKLAVAVIVLWLLVHFNRIDISVLISLSEMWPWLFAAFLLTLPPFCIVSLRFKIILSSQGINVTFRQALRWTMIGSFFDLAMPSSNGGDFIKAGYVVEHVGTGLKMHAAMAVVFDRVMGLLGLFWLAALASVIGWNFLENLPVRYLILGTSIMAALLPVIAFRVAGSRRIYNNCRINRWLLSKTWGLWLKQMIGSFNRLRENPRIVFTSLGLSMLNHFFWCTSLLFITIAMGHVVKPFEGFVVFPLAIFGGVFGVAGGFGFGTAAFDVLFSNLLFLQDGALIGLLFQIFGALSRVSGLPFYLMSKRRSDNIDLAVSLPLNKTC